MVTLRRIRDLTLGSGLHPYFAAASGLVRVNDRLFVVADDELCLGVFPVTGDAPGRRLPFRKGSLPADPKTRKAAKPDLEALAFFPAECWPPNGALLALGSGSTPVRASGVLLPLSQDGQPGLPREVELAPLYEALARQIPNLNLEGAVVVGDRLCLFQRGNGAAGVNARIDLDLRAVCAQLSVGARCDGSLLRDVDRYDLGSHGGVRFSFTDATALPDGRIVFAAVAEDTPDTYSDGPCVAAAMGMLDVSGSLTRMEELQPPIKVEGVEVSEEGGLLHLLLVADQDEPNQPAGLFSGIMPA